MYVLAKEVYELAKRCTFLPRAVYEPAQSWAKPPRAEPCAREGGNARGRISAMSASQMHPQAWCARNAYKKRRSLLGVLG